MPNFRAPIHGGVNWQPLRAISVTAKAPSLSADWQIASDKRPIDQPKNDHSSRNHRLPFRGSGNKTQQSAFSRRQSLLSTQPSVSTSSLQQSPVSHHPAAISCQPLSVVSRQPSVISTMLGPALSTVSCQDLRSDPPSRVTLGMQRSVSRVGAGRSGRATAQLTAPRRGPSCDEPAEPGRAGTGRDGKGRFSTGRREDRVGGLRCVRCQLPPPSRVTRCVGVSACISRCRPVSPS